MLADGTVLESRTTPSPMALRAARVGLGALGIIYSVTLRTSPRTRINRRRLAEAAGRDAGRLDELNAGYRPFRVLRLPPHRDRALPRERPHRRAAAAAEPRQLVYAQEVMLENWVGQAASRGSARRHPAHPALAARRRRRSGARPRSTAATGSSPPSAGSSSPRWSTGSRASMRAEAVERVLELAERRRAAGRLPDRGPLRRRRRLAPEPLARARHVLHRRAPGPRLDWEPYFRAVEAVMDAYGGPPALGQAPFPDRRDAGEPLLPALATTSRRSRARLDPEGASANDYLDRALG